MNDRAQVLSGTSPGTSHGRRARVKDEKINLAHGSGGKAMRELIADVFQGAFGNPVLDQLEDQASFALADLAEGGDRLVFTTDTFVVDPLFVPGGDIGTLAVAGTVKSASAAKESHLMRVPLSRWQDHIRPCRPCRTWHCPARCR